MIQRQDLLPWGQKGSSWESRGMWAERLRTEARTGLTGDGLRVLPIQPGQVVPTGPVVQQQAQCPLPALGPFPAHPELGLPACQVHLPWKENRRRGELGEAPPSTAVQSRTRPGIMAVASVRPILAQGAQGSAGFSRLRQACVEEP